jgi:hypothetical protein
VLQDVGIGTLDRRAEKSRDLPGAPDLPWDAPANLLHRRAWAHLSGQSRRLRVLTAALPRLPPSAASTYRTNEIYKSGSVEGSRANGGRGMTRRFDPRDLALRGRIGAYRLHASHDPRETTARARAVFRSSFERLVDPHGELPPQERLRRADAARRAHYARLARISATARKKPGRT